MASEFQNVLNEIRKRRGKSENIEEEITNEILGAYNEPRQFITTLQWGGFSTGELNQSQSFESVISDFLTRCNGLSTNELYKIFSKLHEKNKGLTLLKKIRDILEPSKNQTNDRQINVFPTYTPLPDLSILPISPPPIELPIDKQVVEKTEKNTILKLNSEPNLEPEIYGKLEDFLQNEQWKKADLETMRVLVEIADIFANPNQFLKDREKITWLDKKEINNIPDEALRNIDKLWNEHTQGHFSFNVQLKIWSQYQRKPHKFDFKVYQDKFSQSIGWCNGKNWIKKYDGFNFSSEAKPGHLPSLSFPNQKNYDIKWSLWKETFEHFLPRLFNCQLI